MSKGGEVVYIPDDSDFYTFREQCESQEGWDSQYNKAGVTVWSQVQEDSKTVQKIKGDFGLLFMLRLEKIGVETVALVSLCSGEQEEHI
ncbi:UNVERIFIED_CONTAM: hypothetical protein K2H54_017017 [Gekko kuhli]